MNNKEKEINRAKGTILPYLPIRFNGVFVEIMVELWKTEENLETVHYFVFSSEFWHIL